MKKTKQITVNCNKNQKNGGYDIIRHIDCMSVIVQTILCNVYLEEKFQILFMNCGKTDFFAIQMAFSAFHFNLIEKTEETLLIESNMSHAQALRILATKANINEYRGISETCFDVRVADDIEANGDDLSFNCKELFFKDDTDLYEASPKFDFLDYQKFTNEKLYPS